MVWARKIENFLNTVSVCLPKEWVAMLICREPPLQFYWRMCAVFVDYQPEQNEYVMDWNKFRTPVSTNFQFKQSQP